jgi:endo-1,4-beta-xylanase
MRGTGIVLGILASALMAGCSSGSGSSGGTGGHAGASGGSSSGGSSSGGSSAMGGTVGSGGSSTVVKGTGGSGATGGSTGMGGRKGTGGAAVDAGTASDVAMGGSPVDAGKGTGGVTGAGGVLAVDGGKANGGATGAGGTKSCGTTAASLKAAADCTGRLIGVALSSQHLNSDSSYTSAAKEFNFVTCENEMKWDQIEPSKGQFSWSAADQIVSFATSNGMKVKGHTLVWYNQLPQWVTSLSKKEDVLAAMQSHIKGVMQHYKGKIAIWDVVNEAVSIEGTSYRDCPFYKYLGESYIDEAFKYAREVDPDVKLYYNDYNDEGLNAKSDFVYKLLKGMVERGVPIDGVGMQMHYGKPNDAFTMADLKANVQRLVDLGLDVVFSEMDVHMCQGMTATEQTTLYHDIVAACVGEPRCKAVTFWGITDKYSWLNSYSPLGCSGNQKPLGDLWDDNYKKKSAYTGVLNALLGL